MKIFFRDSLLLLLAAILAALSTVLLPLLHYALNGDGTKKGEPRIVAQVEVARRAEPPKPERKAQREIRQPQRARPIQTSLPSGPRFAMELGVAGAGGALAPPEIVNRRGGGAGLNAGNADQGVDERPAPAFPPPFRIPDGIREREMDAILRLSFCVDASGRPYEIKVIEEKPAGAGLAQAGREAVQQTTFNPARKGGLAVAFCGLEQPFEVRFTQ